MKRNNHKDLNNYMTVREAAETLGLSISTIYKAIREDRVSWIKKGGYLVHKKSVEHWNKPCVY